MNIFLNSKMPPPPKKTPHIIPCKTIPQINEYWEIMNTYSFSRLRLTCSGRWPACFWTVSARCPRSPVSQVARPWCWGRGRRPATGGSGTVAPHGAPPGAEKRDGHKNWSRVDNDSVRRLLACRNLWERKIILNLYGNSSFSY